MNRSTIRSWSHEQGEHALTACSAAWFCLAARRCKDDRLDDAEEAVLLPVRGQGLRPRRRDHLAPLRLPGGLRELAAGLGAAEEGLVLPARGPRLPGA